MTFTKIGELAISLKPERDRRNRTEVIKIVTDRPNASPLSITVMENVIRPYKFSPQGFTLFGKQGETISRILYYDYDDDEYADIAIGVPTEVKNVSISELESSRHTRKYKVSCTLSSSGNATVAVCAVIKHTQEKVTVPIRINLAPGIESQ
jgi:hypothetical protein